MTEESTAGGSDGGPEAAAPDEEGEESVPFAGLSDDGLMLFFAGFACLLAAVTAFNRGQPGPVVVLGAAAGVVAVAGFIADAASGYDAGTRVHLVVGSGAAAAAGFAAPGRHYLNVATFGAAAALVLWRVFDVEVRGAE